MKPAARSRGQALVLALLLMVIGAAAMLRLFDAGQLVHEKTRLAHAADAVAYSGALVQARALNLQALANRSQVAHQVAMAHLVTLASWARFGETEGQRASLRNPPASLIGMMFGPAHGAAYAAATAAGGAAGQAALAQAFAEHDRVVNDILWRTQLAVVQTLPDVRQRAMAAVLEANYRHGGAPGGLAATLDADWLADDWPGYVRTHRGAARARLRGMVEEATAHYGFMDPRNHTARNTWMVSPRCPARRHELRRRGQTALEGFDTWASADTQSYHALRSNRWIGCYYREYPMGWADVATGPGGNGDPESIDDPPGDFSAQDFWRWVQANTSWDIFNGRTNPLAGSYARAAAVRWRGRGMPGYLDIDPAAAREDRPLRLAVRVTRPAEALAVIGQASRVRAGGATLGASAQMPGDVIAAVSAAQTYFARPTARGDGAVELASLFNPYWQARLSPVTAVEREAALARQGVAS